MAARLSLRGLDRKDLLILGAAALAAALFLLAEHRIAHAPGLPLDDGWIHLTLARNVATGGGFGINRGEPVAVSTAPLWSLALAGLLALGVPGLAAAKGLGLACWVATGLVTRRLAGAIGLPPGLAWGAGLAVVGLSRLVWGALSGMEVPLAALAVAAAAWAIARDRPDLGAAGLGLATLARPEAGLLAALHALGALGAGRWPEALRRAILAALVVAPAVLFNLVAGGRLVPVSAAAKVEGGLLGRTEGLADAWAVAGRQVTAFGADWGRLLLQDHLALPGLLVVGLVVIRRSRLGWLAGWTRPASGRDGADRALPAPELSDRALRRAPLAARDRGGSGRVPARPGWLPGFRLRVAACALLLVGLAWPLPAGARAYAWAVENINTMQVRLGHWVAANTPPDALIALNDIGALTYFGERRVIDLMGLATPEILPYRREGPEAVLRYLGRRCPEYLVIFPDWFPELAARADLFRPATEVTLAHNVVAGAATMTVYETAWRRGPGPTPCPGAPRR